MKTDNETEMINAFMGIDNNTFEILRNDYRRDWNKLMSVVEKMEQAENTDEICLRAAAHVYINHNACIIEYVGDDKRGEWKTESFDDSKKEAVYKAVIDFMNFLSL